MSIPDTLNGCVLWDPSLFLRHFWVCGEKDRDKWKSIGHEEEEEEEEEQQQQEEMLGQKQIPSIPDSVSHQSSAKA